MSSLRRGHANLLCIVPILADDLFRGSNLHESGFYLNRTAVPEKVLWERSLAKFGQKWMKVPTASSAAFAKPDGASGRGRGHRMWGVARTKECSRRGSNSRPWDYETHALPAAPQELLSGTPAGWRATTMLGSTNHKIKNYQNKRNSHRGTRTHDHKIKSLALYQLS